MRSLEDLAGQGLELVQQSAPPDKQVKPAELIDLFKLVAKQGLPPASGARIPQEGGFVIVARGGDRPEVMPPARDCASASGRAGGGRRPVQKAGRTLHPLDEDEAAWWFEKGDLVLSSKPDLVISTSSTAKSPNVVDHPVRTALCGSRTASSRSPPGSSTSPRCRRCPPRPPSSASTA